MIQLTDAERHILENALRWPSCTRRHFGAIHGTGYLEVCEHLAELGLMVRDCPIFYGHRFLVTLAGVEALGGSKEDYLRACR